MREMKTEDEFQMVFEKMCIQYTLYRQCLLGIFVNNINSMNGYYSYILYII